MTEQIKEYLTLDGKEFRIQGEPEISASHEMMTLLDKVPTDSERMITSTACWRQYLAHWAVQDDYLYLVDVEGIYRKECSEPINAEWFTGEISIGEGIILDDAHIGFDVVYELEHRLRFEKGRLIDRQLIDNRGKDLSETEEHREARESFQEFLDQAVDEVEQKLKKEKIGK